ncbi:MAG: hypothetical protein M3444_01800 [Acidobacteriota bacterium]|nr:hypothetical protein [Acidobacteriota bacterium]MDQ5836103.1 hypothetical protein [Acidobacteriota bacterium]
MSESKYKYRGSKSYHLLYCALINAAQNRSTITYKDVAEIMGLPPTGSHMGAETGRMLGVISEDEFNNGRPLLSAVAVSSVSGSPGEGFFGWAKDLGRLKDDSKEGKKRFWEEEKAAVYETWAK